MQVMYLNEVVNPRLPQENVSMPAEVKAALADFWKRVGAKKKWAAYTAAILAFYRLPEEEQYRAMDAVEAARRRKDFRHLLRPAPFDPDSLRVTSTAQTGAGRAPDRPGQQLGRKRLAAVPAEREGRSK